MASVRMLALTDVAQQRVLMLQGSKRWRSTAGKSRALQFGAVVNGVTEFNNYKSMACLFLCWRWAGCCGKACCICGMMPLLRYCCAAVA
jgi:hypothetical protein